jgi:hypothetical protein
VSKWRPQENKNKRPASKNGLQELLQAPEFYFNPGLPTSLSESTPVYNRRNAATGGYATSFHA